MKIRVEEDLGLVAVELAGVPIRLRLPTIRQWADWTIHAQALQRRAALLEPGTMRHEELVLAGPVAALNYEMIRTLAAVSLPVELDPGDPRLLELADPGVTKALLACWWECPLAPWAIGGDDTGPDDGVERAPEPTSRRKDDEPDPPRKITTDLPSALGALSVIYQALSTIGMGAGFTPPEIDRMEIWQVAVLLGRDSERGGEDDDVLGGKVKRRGDGQEGARTFSRDPDQPTFFGANSNRAAALEWLQRKRAAWRERAERAREHGGPVRSRPERRRRWRG